MHRWHARIRPSFPAFSNFPVHLLQTSCTLRERSAATMAEEKSGLVVIMHPASAMADVALARHQSHSFRMVMRPSFLASRLAEVMREIARSVARAFAGFRRRLFTHLVPGG